MPLTHGLGIWACTRVSHLGLRGAGGGKKAARHLEGGGNWAHRKGGAQAGLGTDRGGGSEGAA